jgi:hypothetical protein
VTKHRVAAGIGKPGALVDFLIGWFSKPIGWRGLLAVANLLPEPVPPDSGPRVHAPA